MKKLLILVSAAVLIFGLAAAPYAQDEFQFKASGFIRVRTANYMNTGGAPTASVWEDEVIIGANDAYDRSQAYVDERFRLKFDAVASEDLFGTIYLEGDSTAWGDTAGDRNHMGYWSADRNAVEVKGVYIDFAIPGIKDFAPTRLRAGVQGLSVRDHLFLFDDGAGLRTQTDMGPVRFYLNWFKPEEGNTWMADDTDVYGARVVLNLPDFPVKPGALFFYYNMNQYPLFSGSDSADFYWIGANVDGKIGPVALKTDFIYSTGKVERDAPTAANPDIDYSGWVFYANAEFPIAMITPGVTFMYASGDDYGDRSSTTGATSEDRDGYVVPPASEAGFHQGIVFFSSTINDGIHISRQRDGLGYSRGPGPAGSVGPNDIGGLWMVKGYASIKPLDWLKVTGYGMYIGDTVDGGNAVGNAVDLTATTALEDEDSIGIEVGAYADISIYKGLTYSIGAGYLFAGDALDSFDLAASLAAGAVVNESPNNPWAIVSQLIYTF